MNNRQKKVILMKPLPPWQSQEGDVITLQPSMHAISKIIHHQTPSLIGGGCWHRSTLASLAALTLLASLVSIASFAPTIFQAFKFIAASTFIAHFQLIVNLFLNPYREGVEYVQNISSSKICWLIVEHIFLIVEFNQQHQSTLRQDLVYAWLFIATISIANLETSNNFQRRVMPGRIHQLIVKLSPNTDSEGVLAQENILNATGATLTSEGA